MWNKTILSKVKEAFLIVDAEDNPLVATTLDCRGRAYLAYVGKR